MQMYQKGFFIEVLSHKRNIRDQFLKPCFNDLLDNSSGDEDMRIEIWSPEYIEWLNSDEL